MTKIDYVPACTKQNLSSYDFKFGELKCIKPDISHEFGDNLELKKQCYEYTGSEESYTQVYSEVLHSGGCFGGIDFCLNYYDLNA
jgi:hypothetical protein